MQRFLVAPVQVIEQQQQWLASGKDGTGQGREEKLALPSLRHRSRRWETWVRNQNLWHEPGYFRERRRIESGEAGLKGIAAQPGGDRCIGQMDRKSTRL